MTAAGGSARRARRFGWIAAALVAGGCVRMLHAVQGEDYRVSHACDAVQSEHSLTNELCQVVNVRERQIQVDKAPAIEAGIQFLLDKPGEHDLPYAYDRAVSLDLDAMTRELGAAKVDDLIVQRFTSQVREQRAWVIAAVDGATPHWRDVLIKPGLAARTAWTNGAARRAPWLAKAKALGERVDAAAVDGSHDRALLGALIALHRAYVAECRRGGAELLACLGDEVARPLTHRIIDEAHRLGDDPLAGAEAIFFAAPDRSTIDRAARVAALEAAQAEQQQYEAWAKAKADGRSEAVIHARWPVEPIDTHAITLAGVRSDGAEAPLRGNFVGQIARVERRGERAVITFRRNVTMFTHSTGCHDTNRIDHVENGRVYYQDVCTGPDVTSPIDETPQPATVPWNDARALRPLDVVALELDGKRAGYVVRVRTGDASMPTNLADDEGKGAVVQVRDVRVDDGAPRPAAKAARRP